MVYIILLRPIATFREWSKVDTLVVCIKQRANTKQCPPSSTPQLESFLSYRSVLHLWSQPFSTDFSCINSCNHWTHLYFEFPHPVERCSTIYMPCRRVSLLHFCNLLPDTSLSGPTFGILRTIEQFSPTPRHSSFSTSLSYLLMSPSPLFYFRKGYHEVPGL